MYDVVIIGAGVIGCAIARELSKFKLKILVLEKENDVGCGSSKANSAIIHAGFDAKPDTLKGQLNAKANIMFDKLSKDLDFQFRRNGSLVLCFDEKDIDRLQELKERGERNGVPNLEILTGDEARKLEPNVTDKVIAALFAPSGGIVCPFNLTIALAENAYINGAKFSFNSKVLTIRKIDNNFYLKTENESIITKLVINAAGLYSDKLNNMVSEEKFTITPRRGEYNLFDKYIGNISDKTLFQLPTTLGKGILISPTIDGNLIVGPNATDINDKEDVSTTQEGLEDIMKKALMSVNFIPLGNIITSFSGLRSRSERGDFLVGEAPDVPGFINVANIDSPGLTCSPLLGEMAAEIVVNKLNPEINEAFNPKRKGIVRFSELSQEGKKEITTRIPEYGRIVCRCEYITEGEILASIRRPLGAKDLDGVKRRTRAGAGRCQAGFCISRVIEILQSELNIPKTKITKFGGQSNILVGTNKENF